MGGLIIPRIQIDEISKMNNGRKIYRTTIVFVNYVHPIAETAHGLIDYDTCVHYAKIWQARTGFPALGVNVEIL
jgi:hypothetical protein